MGIYTYLPQELRPFERIVSYHDHSKMPYWGFVSLGVGIAGVGVIDCHENLCSFAARVGGAPSTKPQPPRMPIGWRMLGLWNLQCFLPSKWPVETGNWWKSPAPWHLQHPSNNISATFQRERGNPWSKAILGPLLVTSRSCDASTIHPNYSRWIELQLYLFMSLASKISQWFCWVPSCIPSTSKNSTRFLTKALNFGDIRTESLK